MWARKNRTVTIIFDPASVTVEFVVWIHRNYGETVGVNRSDTCTHLCLSVDGVNCYCRALWAPASYETWGIIKLISLVTSNHSNVTITNSMTKTKRKDRPGDVVAAVSSSPLSLVWPSTCEWGAHMYITLAPWKVWVQITPCTNRPLPTFAACRTFETHAGLQMLQHIPAAKCFLLSFLHDGENKK